jgi:GntR family transcriptional regulator / MocR family aminotransferase
VREAIRAGRLAAGERLPSSRALARELGVSRGLVLEAYAQLRAEGYLTSHGGSATRVADAARAPPAPGEPVAPRRRFAVSFRPGTPDLGSFPRRDWAWAVRDVLRDAPADASTTRTCAEAGGCARFWAPICAGFAARWRIRSGS